MRLDVVRRLKPASPAGRILRHAWKYALGVGIAAVLVTAGGADRAQPAAHVLATNVLPTTVPCGPIATDPGNPHTATWTAVSSPYGTGSPYNLPVSTTNNTDPTVQPCDAIIVPADVTLKIDPSQGSVQIFSHGAAITVDGGHLVVTGSVDVRTGEVKSALFDAEPDVASWDGIVVDASDSNHRGTASLAFASVQHALNSITITSGATSTVDPTDLRSQLPYGLALINSGIGPSYFDGIDATNTPILVKGETDSGTHRADGKFGTVNNIGSQGIKISFDSSAPAVPAALDVESVTFGSSVPFGETSCLPLQVPCSAGSIGNDAILGTFTSANPPPVIINQSRFYRAGSFGVELNGSNRPVITDNNFDCNGTGSPKPKETCIGTGLKYSAIYLNNATADLENSVTNNVGHEDGLDAIGFSGTIVYASGASPQVLTWKSATNDAAADHLLGYLLNGDLNLTSGTLVVPDGSVVKSRGTINLTGAALDASSSGAKVFTSLRDNVNITSCPSVFVQSCPSPLNITSCPSVFVQSCPSPLPAGEWGGIDLVGSSTDATIRDATTGTINNAAVLYATTGVHITNGKALTITGSAIGPTFADGVLAEGTPIAVTGTTFGCPSGVCTGPSSGNHGILADFHGAPNAGGLTVGGPNLADRNTFQGSVNEAIRGVGLSSQPVDIENNLIQNAGAAGSAGSAGIYLEGADKLTLKANDVEGSGTGTVHYPAIWLDLVRNADFSGPISDNTGSGNALNAIAFHGDTKTLAWQTVHTTGQLGFIVDGNLLVAGDLTLSAGYAPVLAGTITVRGALTSTDTVLTSLKEQTASVASCGSVFVPKVSGVCAPQSAGDWGGLVLDQYQANRLTDSEVRYAGTGISMSAPTVAPTVENLTLLRTNVRNTSADGVTTHSPVSITGGAFSNNGGRGIRIDFTGIDTTTVPPGAYPINVTGTTVSGSGQDGILAVGLAGQTVQIEHASVDHTGAFGINLIDSGKKSGAIDGLLTLENNTVTSTAAGFPAIYLNGFTGPFANINNNAGASNGLDAIAFHGTVTDSLAWQTARKTDDPTQPLGYLLDGTLTMETGKTLKVQAGDIVKVGNGGALDLHGVNLQGDSSASSSQKVFTSLSDNSAGVVACPSALLPSCTGASSGDWAGISLTGSDANGTLVNAAIRYAATGILITSGPPPPALPSAYRLVVSQSSIGQSAADGIKAVKTSISVTNSTVSGGTHGITVDDSGAGPSAALRLSGNRFMSTSAEAILGQALAGQPVWISDNQVQGAGTFGIRLLSANQLVLRNNNISGSGGGPAADAGRYPAIYLNPVNADFAGNVRGNVGRGNGLDAIALHGTVTGAMSWITPTNNSVTTHPLGYLLDGGLTLDGGDLTVNAGDVVKTLGGSITINGGNLIADDDSSTAIKTFTSLRDNSGAALDAVSCPSIFVSHSSCGTPAPNDWGGLVITENSAGKRGNAAIEHGLIDYATTGIAIDSGPLQAGDLDHFGDPLNFRLTIANGTQIVNTGQDGINASDTSISVNDGIIGDPFAAGPTIGGRGIFATYVSPPNCSSTEPDCSLSVSDHSQVAWTVKDGILANGLNGQPVAITDSMVTHAGTYGIRLVGADRLTLSGNTVDDSGLGTLKYPAIHLSHVIGDFKSDITGNDGTGNGVNALVFDGTADGGLDWITPLATPPALGYLLDGDLTVIDGDLTTKPGDIVRTFGGEIDVNNGALISDGTVFTSLKDNYLPPACPSVLLPSPCSPAPTDWEGINIDGLASSFTGGDIRYAASGLTTSRAKLTVDRALMTGVTGYAIHTTNGGYAAVTCSGIHGNGGGISSEGAAGTTIASSDLYGNSGLGTTDLDATVDTTATNDWWGGYPPSPTQHSATHVTINNALRQQEPSVKVSGGTIDFSSDNANDASAKFGKGTLTVTLTFDREMDLSQALVVTFDSTIDNVAHAINGDWKGTPGDRVTWIGHVLLDGTTATAQGGSNTLRVSGGRSCMRDGSRDMLITESEPFTLDFGTATVAATGGATNVGATSATLNDSVNPNGWSHGVQPPALSTTDSHVFFQYKRHADAYAVDTIADLQALADAHPAGLLGYQSIEHGNAPVQVSANLPSGTLDPNQDYDYRVIAADLNGITKGNDQHFITTGTVDHFDVAGPSNTQAGDPYVFTVKAKDAGGVNTVEDYSGTVDFSSSDAQFVLASSTLNKGTKSFTAPLKTAGMQSITATDHAVGTIHGSKTGIQVNPAGATTLEVKDFPSPTTAGQPRNFTVTAKDAYGNTATGYSGTVDFTSTDSQFALTSSTLTNGTKSFNAALKTVGPQSITATDHAVGTIVGSQVGIQVDPADASMVEVKDFPSPTTAGQPQNFTVTARDAYGNKATGYSGTVDFTSTDPQFALSSSTLTNGTKTFNAALKTAGTQSITATDSTVGSIHGSQSGIQVTAAGAATFEVTGYPSPTTAGQVHSFRVTATDAYGNTATGYGGTVDFTSTDPQFALASSTLSGGTKSLSVALKTAGTQSITATDSAVSSLHASQTGIQVTAAGPTTLAFASAPQNLAVNAASSTMTVQLRDDYGNASDTGANLSIDLTSSAGTGIFLDSTNATVTSQTMSTGTHVIQFKYQDSAGGNPLLTAHASTIAHDGTQTESVAAKLVFTSAAQLIQTGSVSDTMTIQLQDGSGASVNAVAPLTVNLSSDSGTGVFRDSSTGNTTITTVSIAASSATATFKYKDTTAGTPTLTAQSAGPAVTDATQKETVADQLAFTTLAQTLTGGSTSGVITVQLQDGTGTAVVAASNLIIQLVLPSTDPTGEYRNTADTAPITTVVITAGSSSADFKYKPNASGSQTITATAGHGISDAEQTETVS